MKYFLLTIFALFAFAGNSILCRLALGEGAIDAASFTSIRLLTGVAVLLILLKLRQKNSLDFSQGDWVTSLMLFIYAIGFSYAYVSLETGTGALILFASVQITIIAVGIFSGNKLFAIEWLGVIIAFFGFTYLVLPGVSAPPLLSFILMSASGVAWGFYTLAGKNSKNPLGDTANNFLRTIPFVVILTLVTFVRSNISLEGVILAMLSGGLASGVGYTIWYMALEGLSATQAAVVQLFVPVIAALAGIFFANEVLTLRLVVSSIMILGGILIVILGKYYFERKIIKT